MKFIYALLLSSALFAEPSAKSSWQAMVEKAQGLLQKTTIDMDNALLQTYQGYMGKWVQASARSAITKICKKEICDSKLFFALNEISASDKYTRSAGFVFVPYTKRQLQAFEDSGIERQKIQIKKGQYLWPTPGIRITSRVGTRWGRLHGGIDIAAARGSIVVGATEGRVLRVGDQGPYGNCVLVENSDGTLAWYAHLSEWVVKVGDKIQPGQLVGFSGNTGRSTGPHLHFEIRTQQGVVLDPEQFFFTNYEENLKESAEYELRLATKGKVAASAPSVSR